MVRNVSRIVTKNKREYANGVAQRLLVLFHEPRIPILTLTAHGLIRIQSGSLVWVHLIDRVGKVELYSLHQIDL
jgi:hypothetical protein